MKLNKPFFKILMLIPCIHIGTKYPLSAQDLSVPKDTITLPKVELLSKKEGKLFKHIPGAVHQFNAQDLNRIMALGSADVFRKIPGMHVNDEDPASLRFNVGLRGLYPQRSSRVLILEDGIPLTLNPYGEPALYFSPMIDQLDGVEILKSSGQLLYGPQTIGGVINLITPDPPSERQTRVRLEGGPHGFFSGHLRHGQSVGNAGYLFTYQHKRTDQLGPLQFDLHNATAKFTFQSNEKSKLAAKIGFNSEKSNATYVGLTQTMFDKGQYVQQTLAPNDLMLLDRYHASLIHDYQFSSRLELKTLAFAYYIRRNWRRQNFDRKAVEGQIYERIIGDPNATDGSSIFFRDNAQWRNRQYVVKGFEPKLRFSHQLWGAQHVLQTGIRVLWETAYEQALHTPVAQGYNGDSRNNEQRDGFATSVYAVQESRLNDQWSATLGLRLEQYDMKRAMYKSNSSGQDLTHRRDVTAWIPGVGLTYAPIPEAVLFAGIHKGFSPPELKSALNNSGIVDEIDKEESYNYELGARIAIGNILHIQPTFFYLDFKNQQIPVLLSTAGSGFANGGKSIHKGAELGVVLDLGKWTQTSADWGITGNFTYTDARFANDDARSEGDVIERVFDNVLPYAPQYMFNHTVYATLPFGLDLYLAGNYISKQYHDGLNTEIAPADGTTGAIPARYIIEATLGYTLKNKYTFKIAGKNLTNKTYITSRSPQGIRVGLDRFVSFGVDIKI